MAPRAANAVGAPATETRPDPQRLAETVQGRVVIVTGGATGLGRATALEFAQHGTAVGINYVDLPDRDVAAQALLTETAIRALPLKQRLAFTLRKMHELDYEVIGQSIDCSPESARAHVFQALRKIRTTLNGHALPSTEPTR